jgi:hypothetical protein
LILARLMAGTLKLSARIFAVAYFLSLHFEKRIKREWNGNLTSVLKNGVGRITWFTDFLTKTEIRNLFPNLQPEIQQTSWAWMWFQVQKTLWKKRKNFAKITFRTRRKNPNPRLIENEKGIYLNRSGK